MNEISETIVRKKISIHAKILASVLFLALGCYAVSPILKLPSFAYALFPVWIWGRVAIINGPTYLVISSVLLLMACVVPLFVWGHAYQKKEHYALRLRIWFVLFSVLLGYTLLMSTVIHIAAMFPPKHSPPPPPGAAPMGYRIRDLIFSREANTPTIYSMEFILFLIVMLLYSAEAVWVHCLLTRAKKLRGKYIYAKGG
jgi:hypothetical protein